MAADVRLLAARGLASVLGQGRSLNQSLPPRLEQAAPRDRGLLQELCYGTLRWQPQLDMILRRLMDRQLKSKDSDVQALLLLGLYQLIHMRIPDHAAIASCVEAGKKVRKPWAGRLINGVLRNFQRQREELETALAEDPRYRYSHPEWLLESLRQYWPHHWADILEANNLHPPMTLRVNRRKTSRDDYVARLRAADIAVRPCPWSPVGVTLLKPQDPHNLPGFTAGDVSVQDEAAQLAAFLLNLAPDQRVLDACCAPGGKACHILETEDDAALVGVELDPERLDRVRQNLDRLELKARLVAADAASPAEWWDGQSFDRILLDAPCSGTGVIRRHPDIKLLRRDADIAKLAQLQQRLLDALWRTLKPGGRLVYATCSVLPPENEQLVEAFLAATPDAVHREISADWGEPRPFGRQLFPEANGHDGFYYAVLEKHPG